VGDLAIYLVTRGLSVADVTDESKAAGIDFPASVIDLLEGRLGFPHRGFPAQVGREGGRERGRERGREGGREGGRTCAIPFRAPVIQTSWTANAFNFADR